jgi:hypothetical protein
MDLQTIINNNINGATFVSLDVTTVPTVRKTVDTEDGREPNAHFGRVRKHTQGMTVMLFQNKKSHGYMNMVKRRLEKEGKDPSTFELSERKWGVRLQDQPFVEHKGELYLEAIMLNAGTTHYTIDGVEVDKDDIVGLSKPREAEQGGLDDKVILRTFKTDSITQITIGKVTHK